MSLNKIRYSYSALQEKMWIEIIQEMENLYAKLANNLTEIEKKTRELSEAREFVENVLNSMSDTLIVTDKKGIIRKVNRAALNLLGYQEEEILGKLFEKLLLSSKKEKFSIWRKITAGKNAQFYQNFLTKKGEKIPASFNTSFLRNKEGKIAGVIVVGRDLRKIKQLLKTAREAARAERKKAKELEKAYHYLQNLQTKLIQSEKLASIGRLAAGVAHEINNPLTAVLTFAHLLLRSMPEDDPRRADVEVIIREANHCRMITRNLLDFARQTQPNKRPVDIKQIVEKTLSLVKNQVSFQNIRIIKEFNISLPLLNVDPNQMEQVFMNIILNAQEAMLEGGFLTISTDFGDDGKFVEVKFIDTGCGIPRENLDKLFEPFFTTKNKGKGTGLGLSISYGIVKSHGGEIVINSSPGKGTTVVVRLPVREKI